MAKEVVRSGIQERGCAAIIQGLEAIDLDFFIHLPDSTAAGIIQHFQNHPKVKAFSIAREEEGVGIAAGMSIGGKRCVLFIQDTGLGNSMTALTTFAQAYHVPLLILAVRRGGLGEYNSAVHAYSENAVNMLEAMQIKAFVLDYRVPIPEWGRAVRQAFQYSLDTHRPIIVFLNLKE